MLRDARYAHLAAALALLVGLMAAVAGLLRLGFVADLLSRPVLVGYMADAGSGLLRRFPVSSSATRTAIAVATGARSQLYSVITAVTVITALLFARPGAGQVPDSRARRDRHLCRPAAHRRDRVPSAARFPPH